MKRKLLISGFLLLMVASMGMGLYRPTSVLAAGNTDTQVDRNRQTLIAANQCFDRTDVIDTDDSVTGNTVDDAYGDLIRDGSYGHTEKIIVGFDLDGGNGVDSCLNLMPRALGLAHATSFGVKATDEASGRLVMLQQYVLRGSKFLAGSKYSAENSNNLNSKVLGAQISDAIKRLPPPSTDIIVPRIAALVGDCFSFTTDAKPINFNEGRGDFQVPGLGTFEQKQNIDWKNDFNWIKANDGIISNSEAAIGNIGLSFGGGTEGPFTGGSGDFTQNNTDKSSDFFPLGPEISQSPGVSGYTGSGVNADNNPRGAIVDCHFVKKNAGWIFTNHKLWGADANGQVTFKGQKVGAIQSDADKLSKDTNVQCEAHGISLSWLICPIVNGLADATDAIFTSLLQPLLQTGAIDTSPTGTIFTIWSNFRLYGNILLVIALLVVVFGQSIGGGLVDAYTARKVLPRLLLTAILINLSIYIVALLVDITNILGSGIYGVITAPLHGHLSFTINIAVPGVVGLGVGGLVAAGVATSVFSGAALPFILLFIVLPAFLAMMAVIGTLVFRRALIILLILVSPIAFALYVLPNTEQYFKKWWDLLFRTLMVYPIALTIIAGVNVLAATIGIVNKTSGGVPSFVGQLLAMIAIVLPLFVIPFAFKMAGGVVASVYNSANGLGKKITEAVKGNPNDPNSLRNRTKQGLFARVTRDQQRVVDAGNATDPNDRSFTARRRRARGGFSGIFGNVPGRTATYNKIANQRAEDMSATGRDDLRYAGAGYILEAGEAAYDGSVSSQRRFFDAKGRQINGSMYRKGKGLFGGNMHAVGAQLEYATRKAQTDEDIGNMRFAMGKNAIANNWNNTEMRDVWAQATFPHKDKWLSEWYSTPTAITGAGGRTTGVQFQDVSTNVDSLDKMVGEQHRVKESFRAGSLRAQDWQAQHDAMMDIQARLGNPATRGSVTARELSRYARISENLDTMARAGMAVQNEQGEVMVSGAPAEAQGVITAMYKSRKYAAAPLDTGGGQFSTTDRALYDVQAVNAARTAAGRGSFDQDAAIRANTIAQAQVSDDRSGIPTSVT